MRKIAQVGFASIMLSGCLSIPEKIVSVKSVSLTSAQVTAMQSGVIASLKDPESARFGAFAAGLNNEGETFVCGYVNAKNSYGGYVGQQPFNGYFVASGKFVAHSIGGMFGDKTAKILWLCNKQGLSI